jgi:uncharacterized phage protein (TIGR01671 family)
MREIKFRVWDSQENEMKNWEDIKVWSICTLNNNSKEVVMQFTGLKDKDGADIYENDLVRDTVTNEILVIKFNNKNACFCAIKQNQGHLDLYYNLREDMASKRLVVVGNIYENRELKKG